MSAARPSSEPTRRAQPVRGAQRPRDMSQLRSRRREAERRRRLLRVDLGVGLVGAIALWIIAPGLAIVALVALVLLTVCGVSVVLERRRSRRR